MKKLSWLTVARYFAALGVFCFHILPRWIPEFDSLPRAFTSLVSTGYIFVPFFFILSGFVLEYTYGEQAKLNLKDFFVKRFARIAPVFYLSLCLGLVPVLMAHNQTEANSTGKLAYCFIVNIFFLGSWFPVSGILNYPAWSIHAEMFFYLLFPFLLLLGSRHDKNKVLLQAALWILAGCALHGISAYYNPEFLSWNGLSGRYRPIFENETLAGLLQTHPIAHLPEFALGIQLSRLYRLLPPMRVRWSLAGVILGTCAVLAVEQVADLFPYLWLNSVLLAPFFGTIVYCLAQIPWSAPSFLLLLGESSYSLYILHVPLRDWCAGIHSHFFSQVNPYAFAAVGILSIHAAAIISYKLVELPGRKFIVQKLLKKASN